MRVSRTKLLAQLTTVLYKRKSIHVKCEGDEIVVPQELWLYFLQDMGIILGEAIFEVSRKEP